MESSESSELEGHFANCTYAYGTRVPLRLSSSYEKNVNKVPPTVCALYDIKGMQILPLQLIRYVF